MYTAEITDWFDVTTFGANVTASINLALEAIIAAYPQGGGVLYFPPGIYTIAAGTQIANIPSGVTVRGCGCETSIILSDNLTADILTLENATGVMVQDIGLQYSEAATNGAGILLDPASNVRISDVAISNASTGIAIDGGSSNVYCVRVRIQSPAGIYAGILATGGNSNIHFTDCELQGALSSSSGYACWLENVSQVFMTNCNAVGFDYGLMIYPYYSAASKVQDVWIANCSWNTSWTTTDTNPSVVCWIGPGTEGCEVTNVSLTGCTFANSYYAVTTEGGAGYLCSGVLFTDCTMRGNGQSGVEIQGADHVQVVGCSIYGNSLKGSASYNGVTLDGASDVVVANCLINAKGYNYADAYQGYAIVIYESANVVVTGCDVTGNVYSDPPATPAIYVDSTSGPSCLIQGNSGYNPFGPLPSGTPAVPGNVAGQQRNIFGSAATIYCSKVLTDVWISATASPVAADLLLVAPKAGDPIRLAPGQWITVSYSGTMTWLWFLD